MRNIYTKTLVSGIRHCTQICLIFRRRGILTGGTTTSDILFLKNKPISCQSSIDRILDIPRIRRDLVNITEDSNATDLLSELQHDIFASLLKLQLSVGLLHLQDISHVLPLRALPVVQSVDLIQCDYERRFLLLQ